MSVTDFLLARIAEDERTIPCEWNCHERVYVECEARRRIVALHGGDYDSECQSPAHLDGPCRTLRALASAYADHPDYRQEWKP